MNPPLPTKSLDASAEITALIEVLHATDRRLEELLGGEVDTVMHRDGGAILLRRAQSHLRESENARQAAVLNALPAHIALLDTRGVIVSVNEAWRQFADANAFRAPGHGLGVNYLDVCDRARGRDTSVATEVGAGIHSVLSGGVDNFSTEYRCDSPTQERWFLLTVTPLPGDPPKGAVVMHLNITERKKAVQALEAMALRTELRERMLSTMLSSIDDFTYIYDRGGRFLFANQALLDLWGLTLAEVVGKNFVDLGYPAALAEKLGRQVRKVFETRGTVADQTSYVSTTGVEGCYEYIFSPAFAADGSVEFVVGSTRDITQRKHDELEAARANQDLKRQQAELRVLFDLMPAMVWFKDTENNILRVNQRVAQAAGLEVAQIEGRRSDEIYPLEAARYHADDLDVIRSGTPKLGIVETVRGSDGSEIWVRTDKVPYRDESGKVIGIVVVAQDITELKRDQETLRELNADLEIRVRARTAELDLARDEAEKANLAKSAFLATMSHEIRTPMNGVIGMIEVLQQTSLQVHQVEMIDLIRDSAFSLLQIIEDILDFSRIEAGKLDVDNVPMELAATVENVCGMLDHLAVKRGVRMTVFVDPSIARTVMGDKARLRQVLVNLAGNAIKFSGGREKPGHVSVRVVLVEREAQVLTVDLIVADDGIGIEEAALARLFTPFSQADASTTRRFGGSGLGLAISGMLVQLMGGSITVRSVVDHGSTFTVRLRFTAVEGASADADTAAEGLHCRIVGRAMALAEDFEAYLKDGKAIVERSPDLAAAAGAARAPGLEMWLILPGPTAPTLAQLRAMAPTRPGFETRFIVLGWGGRRRPLVEAIDLVIVDADTMSRRALLQVLALASGRLKEEGPKEEPPATIHDQPPSREEARSRGRLILIAEDNETNRLVSLRQLALIGYTAEVAVDGRDALERWRTGDFALVLTDLHMPEMDGYELTRAIRAEEWAGRRTPIIALTANALRDEELRCLAAGMDAYLSKPVRLAQLKASIEAWIGPAAQAGEAAKGQRAPVAPTPPADLDVLMALVGDDPVVIAEVLQSFRESAAL